MADGHCFISYSNVDALEFATRLANELEAEFPPVYVWFDKRKIKAGHDWGDDIAEGIKSCKCFLYVLTKDSTTENSVCKQEWDWALRCKKPIVPLHLDPDAELPFRLGTRQWIEFQNFERGFAKLRNHLAWMESPDGKLYELNQRLLDAQRALSRVDEETKPRIQMQIEDLQKEITGQQEIVNNPEAAKQKTEQSIQTGLERERNPEKPLTGKVTTKFINPPPGIAPNYYQDRYDENVQIRYFLKNDAQRILTVVGRAGIGKTAMVCRLLKALEAGHLPDDLGDHRVNGIVYLSEVGSHKVNFANIFADLCKLLPSEKSAQLDGLYKDPKTSIESKTFALMESFSDGQVVLLLDNFENLIETENIRDAELNESLNAFLCGPHHNVKIILTTRVAPHDLSVCEPGRQYILRLDEGLESPHAENMLKELDADGKLGLKNAQMELLSRARVRTRGYPRALEALAGILSADYNTTLEEIIIDKNIPLPQDVVKKLVGDAFSRLDSTAQKVMQALAIYDRPVTSTAIDYLLQPHIEGINSSPILQRLVNMHFARRESGKFYLHPVDSEYALGRINLVTKTDSEIKDIFSKQDLTIRAADYFAQARKPRAEWKKLDDLSAQLAEFDLRCAAGDYDTAANVLTEIDFDYLFLWGHYRLMIEMHEKIHNQIKDSNLEIVNTRNLGIAYKRIGKVHIAIKYYDKALELSRTQKNLGWESAALNSLGLAYADLGDVRKAIEFYEQALTIDREIGDLRCEDGELSNLGNAHADLGDARKAIEFYEQALVIAREIGDRRVESAAHVNTGMALLSLGEYIQAIDDVSQAIQIANDISYSDVQIEGYWTIAQAHLFQNDLINAHATIEAAIKYDVPQYNHNASALHGIIALRQGDEVMARGAFVRAIGQADEILSKTAEYYEALDAKGMALAGLAICGESEMENRDFVAEAVETFRKARKIAPHAGIVKSVLRLFDELAKCDTEGILKDVRKAAEGIE